MKTQFLGGAYLARSVNLNAQRCINMFAEMTQEGRDVGALYNTPGLLEFVDLGAEYPIVGGIVAGSYLWVVSNERLYKIDVYGQKTDIGAVVSSGRVSMAYNGTQIAIATGGTGRLVTVATDTIADISSNYPSGAATICYIDGYFIVEDADTQAFYQSDLNDGAAWDALAFGSKEGAPDNLVAVVADHRELWLFGAETTEVWYNAGTSPLAFARTEGAFMEHGIVSPYAWGKMENTTFWVSQDRNGNAAVFAASGYHPERISTPAVEYAIGQLTLTDCFGWTYQQEGHSFISFTFPISMKTWCFDVTTKLWHERAYLDGDGFFTRHRANCAFNFNGQTVVGDYANGKLYYLDLDTVTDDGNPIKRLRAWGHIHNNGDRLQVSKLELICETGTALDGDVQGSDPQCMLRWSDDGGHTWSNEHWRDLGRLGEYGKRVIWRRLGITRDRVFELSVTDPVKVAWIGAEIQAKALR